MSSRLARVNSINNKRQDKRFDDAEARSRCKNAVCFCCLSRGDEPKAGYVIPATLIHAMKSIIVDWDNPSDIKRTIHMLRNRRTALLQKLGYHEATLNSVKVHADHGIDMLEQIMSCDLSSVYVDRGGPRDYYVYAQCDPTKTLNPRDIKHFLLASRLKLRNEPFYVGKGCGGRASQMDRNSFQRKVLAQIAAKGHSPESVVVAKDLAESAALALEAKLIDILGLRTLSQNGLLTNIDEGSFTEARRRCYPQSEQLSKFFERNGFSVSPM